MQGLIVASLAAYAIAGLASIVIIALRGQDPPAELTTTMATAVGALGGRLTK